MIDVGWDDGLEADAFGVIPECMLSSMCVY